MGDRKCFRGIHMGGICYCTMSCSLNIPYKVHKDLNIDCCPMFADGQLFLI